MFTGLSVRTSVPQTPYLLRTVERRYYHRYIFDNYCTFGPCNGKLNAVETRYLLTSITWLYRGLSFRTYLSHLFSSWPLTRYWFSIVLQVQARLLFLQRRRDYVQRQNSGAIESPTRSWVVVARERLLSMKEE